jgi:hypothetical protein
MCPVKEGHISEDLDPQQHNTEKLKTYMMN